MTPVALFRRDGARAPVLRRDAASTPGISQGRAAEFQLLVLARAGGLVDDARGRFREAMAPARWTAVAPLEATRAGRREADPKARAPIGLPEET